MQSDVDSKSCWHQGLRLPWQNASEAAPWTWQEECENQPLLCRPCWSPHGWARTWSLRVVALHWWVEIYFGLSCLAYVEVVVLASMIPRPQGLQSRQAPPVHGTPPGRILSRLCPPPRDSQPRVAWIYKSYWSLHKQNPKESSPLLPWRLRIECILNLGKLRLPQWKPCIEVKQGRFRKKVGNMG